MTLKATILKYMTLNLINMLIFNPLAVILMFLSIYYLIIHMLYLSNIILIILKL